MKHRFASTRIDVGTITLNVIDVGEGPAVLLLHGFPDRAAMWSAQIQYLTEQGYRVIAPDLRGFGDSDRPTGVEHYTIELLVADVAALLNTLQVPKVILVGHDWGASLAWTFAAVLPQMVAKLAVMSVGHPRAFFTAADRQRQLSWYILLFNSIGVCERLLPEQDWRWYRQWAFADAHRSDNEQLATQLADLARPGALEAGLNWYRANIPAEAFIVEDGGHALANVTCPVLGVWSDRDMALTEEQMTGSAKFVDADWDYIRIPGVGHWVPTDAADTVNALLHNFFRNGASP
jgi:pimeloyl-ACP methyl ester carboxylesterase